MKSCNFNHNNEIYGSEYDENGDHKRPVLMGGGRAAEYAVTITKRTRKIIGYNDVLQDRTIMDSLKGICKLVK